MSPFRSSLIVAAVVALGIVNPAQAQNRSAVSQSDLDAAVAVQSADPAAAVRGFLASESGRQAASRLGVTTTELSARVATMDPATLQQLAERSKGDAPVLAGGANIVISTTAVIIALLLLILIVD